MKRLILLLVCVVSVFSVAAQEMKDVTFQFTEASDLTLVGKVFPQTPNPYQRMDFTKYGGWDEKDIHLLEMSTGIIVSFKTDSPIITVKPEYSFITGAVHRDSLPGASTSTSRRTASGSGQELPAAGPTSRRRTARTACWSTIWMTA
jgi:hypothetical protein